MDNWQMDNKKFILEVQSHSIWFETAHPFHKDNSKKDKMWAEIAQKFGIEGGPNIFHDVIV